MPDVFALQSMFEGLFVRAVQPEGEFKARLRAKGFDVDRQKMKYPISVWEDCLEIAATELYPDDSRATAWRLIGRRFIDGYFQTLVGRMITTMLPFLDTRRLMGRLPSLITTGLQGVSTRVEWKAENQVLITMGGIAAISASLMAGVLEGVLARMKLKETAVLEPAVSPAGEAELLVTFP